RFNRARRLLIAKTSTSSIGTAIRWRSDSTVADLFFKLGRLHRSPCKSQYPSKNGLILSLLTNRNHLASDYDVISQTVTIPANTDAVEVPLHVKSDSVAEPDETVIITLVPAAAYAVGDPSSATITIKDRGSNSAPKAVPDTYFTAPEKQLSVAA